MTMRPTERPGRSSAAWIAITCVALASAARAGPFAEKVAGLDDPAVMEEVVKAGAKALPDVAAALKGPRADLAVQALGRMKLPAAARALVPLAKNPDGELRASVAWALGRCGGPQAAKTVIELASDGYAPARCAAVWALARLRTGAADAAVAKALRDPEEPVRLAAADAVRIGGRKDLFRLLLQRLAYRVENVAERSGGKAKANKKTPAKPVWKVVWSEPSVRVRLAAIKALADLKVPDALPGLIVAMEREESFNRLAIIRAIEGFGESAAPVCLGRIVPIPYDKTAFAEHMPMLINNGTLAVIAGRLGDRRCVRHLRKTLKLPRERLGTDKDLTALYIETVGLLGRYRAARGARPLAEMLKQTRVRQLSEAVQAAIRAIGRPCARPLAANLDNWQMAPTFFRLLREKDLQTHAARDAILTYLAHESDEVRLEATETLGLYLCEGVLDEYDAAALEAMYLDASRDVRASCAKWTARIAAKTGRAGRD